MKKILIMSHILPPAIDGGSRIIFKVGDEMRKKGYEVIGLCSNCRSSDDFVNKRAVSLPIGKDSFTIYRIPVYRNLRRLFKGIGLVFEEAKVWSKGPIFKLGEFWSVEKKLRRSGVEVVIAGPMPTTVLIYAKMLAWRLRAKLVVIPCFHENDKDFHRRAIIRVLESADLVGTLSAHEKDYLDAKYGITKSLVLGGGVDKDLILPPEKVVFPKQTNILYLGNFSAHKRVELLIDTFELMAKENENISLTIAGQRTLYYPRIEERLEMLEPEIRSKIKVFPDGYDQRTLKNLIDKCSMLVLPSLHESFGIVFLEAWARGKPVIGANIKPVAELMKKTGGGLTFAVDNEKDLKAKISELTAERKAREMGQRGMKAVENCYTWEKIASTLCQKIEEL